VFQRCTGHCFFLLTKNPHLSEVLLVVFVSQIECAALGRIYLSPVDELPSLMSPPRPRAMRRHSASPYSLPTLQQTHTEVWVATCEASVAYIEIVDVLSKVHNRFSLTVSMLLYVTMTLCHTVICYNITPWLLQTYHMCLNLSLLAGYEKNGPRTAVLGQQYCREHYIQWV